MNCDWLETATAFDCVPVRGPHGERGVEIGTAISGQLSVAEWEREQM